MVHKTQNLNFFTFAVILTHISVQGSLGLKHVHCPVHPCSGLLPHLINSHKASGRSAPCRTYLPLVSLYSYYSGYSIYCWLTRAFAHVRLAK